MTPRKTILRELSRSFEESGGASFTRPSTIRGFSAEPDRFQKAVNELLTSRLVEGHKDPEGHMAIALNGHKIREVRREIRPLWAHPAVWVFVVLAVVAAGAGLMV